MKLTSLDRKLFRDLVQMRGQSLAIALVIAAGVATFVNSQSMLRSLESTRTMFYERHRFAHVFASAKRVPATLAPRLAAIPGVGSIETRIREGVTLDVPGAVEPAFAQLISLPDQRPPLLNKLYLRRGRLLASGRNDEVLVSEKFVNANALDLGDQLSAVINGRRQSLTIVGVVLSPEYVFAIKPGDLVPDPKHFAVLWMNQEALEMAFDMEGAFDDLAVELQPGASEADVIFRIDRLLDPYGGRGAYGRKDQLSHLLLEGDIEGLKTMGLIVPSIFLAVAAFLLNVVLTRMLNLQREQIASLKAFGYTNLDIALHYLKFVLVITAVGAVVGSVGGVLLSRDFTRMVARVYQYPELLFRVRWDVLAMAVGVATLAVMVGAWGAVTRAVAVPPAEAMRPEAPASFKPTILERLGVGRWLPAVARMVLRQLERKPIKTTFSVLAIALAVGIVVVGNFVQDSIDYVLQLQFHLTQQYDMSIATVEPLDRSLVSELAALPGVLEVRPVRTVPARLIAGHRERRVPLTGVDREHSLMKLVSQNGSQLSPPPGGFVISTKLAELLEVRAGDTIEAQVLEGKRPRLRLPIVALVDDVYGLSAFTKFEELSRLMGDMPLASGAHLRIDSAQRDDVYRRLKDIPAIAGVTIKSNTVDSFLGTIAENMNKMRMINLSFAVVISFGVVYNSARIALSERSRELATLRVIGFTRQEISAILLGELGSVTLLALPLGLLIGRTFAWLLSIFLDQDVFRFPMIIESSTYALAVSVVLLAATISALLVRQKLDHLDLVAVLKSRE